MDNNKWKETTNIDNVEKNLVHNPGYTKESFHQQARDYIKDMRSQKQEATREGFFEKHKNDMPPEEWENQHKAYEDAWEANKNYSADLE